MTTSPFQLPRRRLAALVMSSLGAPAFAAGTDDALAAAVSSSLRSPKNIARDRYRHPLALLTFFGLSPTQSVLEIEPGSGYWTEILAPYLRARGHYTAALPTGTPFAQKESAAFLTKLNANPAAYSKVQTVPLAVGTPLPGGQDLILSFRNLHDWLADGTAKPILAEIFAALKQGGVFGIEDHRAPANLPQDPNAKNGYVREDYAVTLIESVGFKLVARSNIGDNPRDTKNYPDGVWTLPPALRLGDKDRAKFLAIGESDRWTLKFIKPVPTSA